MNDWTLPPEHERSGYMKDALDQSSEDLLCDVLDDLALIAENAVGADELVARSIDRLVVVKERTET